MKTTAIAVVILFSFFVISCSNQLSDEDIKDQVSMHYTGMSMAAGGGSWHASEIRILKKEPAQKEKDVWLITIETKGIYESPPLGNPVPDEEFCDTLNFRFERNKEGFWEGKVVNSY